MWLSCIVFWFADPLFGVGGFGVGCVGGAAVTLRDVVVGVVCGLCAGWWDLLGWGGWWVLLYRVLGEVSGSMLVGTLAYEPESLILAQSERWRNA